MLEQEHFEQILDRRLGDFEKVVDTRLTSIQDGVTRMQESITLFVQKVSNLHIDYIPRKEQEKEQEQMEKEQERVYVRIAVLEKKVEQLQAWRNYLVGAVAFIVVVVGWVIQSHFWK